MVQKQVRQELRDDIITILALFSARAQKAAASGRANRPMKTRYVTHSIGELEGGTVSRERRAATAALDGAGGGWMRPRLALSPVKSHGKTRERTETGGDGTRGE